MRVNASLFPIALSGKIIKGFGRGSKELGIPTANFSEEVVASLPAELSTGIYFGWAQIDAELPEKMVASIGWNPFYKNEKKTVETHILKEYSGDLYDRSLRVLISGYIREERDYKSLDDLIKDIQGDIAFAKEQLERDSELSGLRNHSLFGTKE
uniref:riboflavin kinase n=1 Tax=Caligus rogercresseyi TaxID=217165 RepID=C1BMW3_CALRO|nr:Riboflavin kinase [Caligus rogercresseyi]ACO10944.1 Riboflavin kinase [Caligus rogercresseyi]ACO11571.1 Riboflavin kinase [Caligus rogercresseyi]|eukprot:TRINITY_DN3669_c0_g1_i2.p1 TRINITY_DN3669_c0_g1~~TRINITY_DN3669_c0_g1_i2.p1  ORF type:complete len:154 (-),score=36.13 TRINITY_DN3669_c0_g1_i2:187-648(-)